MDDGDKVKNQDQKTLKEENEKYETLKEEETKEHESPTSMTTPADARLGEDNPRETLVNLHSYQISDVKICTEEDE